MQLPSFGLDMLKVSVDLFLRDADFCGYLPGGEGLSLKEGNYFMTERVMFFRWDERLFWINFSHDFFNYKQKMKKCAFLMEIFGWASFRLQRWEASWR
ncbi:MAG: hypothetical protein FD174_765 [Geobacteraceae bacterium]|nr:MAG: hypothetical protein FD174_765 [Geobacteraceae bacterium]